MDVIDVLVCVCVCVCVCVVIDVPVLLMRLMWLMWVMRLVLVPSVCALLLGRRGNRLLRLLWLRLLMHRLQQRRVGLLLQGEHLLQHGHALLQVL